MGNELGPQFAENSKAAESVENVYGPHQSGNTSGGTIHKEVETQIRIPQFKKFLAPDRQLQTPELAPSQEATEQAAHREVAVSREGGKDEFRDVVRASFEPARFNLRALLKKPGLLTPKQQKELADLVGPEWKRLEVDIVRHRNWAARAVELLQVIASTPTRALSDSHWTALLAQAREAAEEAYVSASRLEGPQDAHHDPRRLGDRHRGLQIPLGEPEEEIGEVGRATREALHGPQRRVDGLRRSGDELRRI
jgi:hypothetical protein